MSVVEIVLIGCLVDFWCFVICYYVVGCILIGVNGYSFDLGCGGFVELVKCFFGIIFKLDYVVEFMGCGGVY